MTPQVVTANALLEGDVVYLAASGAWVRHLHDAQVFYDKDDTDAALAAAALRSAEVVGVYAFEVSVENGQPEATHFRETFRRTGPSNRFHGKQADIKRELTDV